MYTRYYTENIPNAKTSKKQNRPNSILGKSSEITEENLENIILEKPVETEIKMRNLFLIELPDSSVLIFYPNGKKAISKASNGYISFYDDVSSILKALFSLKVKNFNSKVNMI
jgi:hypothetical protein